MNLSEYSQTLRAIVSDDGVVWLTKVNSENGYGISMEMLSALNTYFSRMKSDTSIRAVVIDAEGEAFQNGAVMVGEIKPSIKDLTREDFAEIVKIGHELGQMITELPIPVISLARSGALGGGLELMLCSDFVFCLDDAEFSFPEVTMGFVAAWGGVQFCARNLPYRRAQELLLTGQAIDGKSAEKYGLVTRSFENVDALDRYVTKLLVDLENCSPASYEWTKKTLGAIWSKHSLDAQQFDVKAQVETMSSGDFINALRAYSRGLYYNFKNNAFGSKR